MTHTHVANKPVPRFKTESKSFVICYIDRISASFCDRQWQRAHWQWENKVSSHRRLPTTLQPQYCTLWSALWYPRKRLTWYTQTVQIPAHCRQHETSKSSGSIQCSPLLLDFDIPRTHMFRRWHEDAHRLEESSTACLRLHNWHNSWEAKVCTFVVWWERVDEDSCTRRWQQQCAFGRRANKEE